VYSYDQLRNKEEMSREYLKRKVDECVEDVRAGRINYHGSMPGDIQYGLCSTVLDFTAMDGTNVRLIAGGFADNWEYAKAAILIPSDKEGVLPACHTKDLDLEIFKEMHKKYNPRLYEVSDAAVG